MTLGMNNLWNAAIKIFYVTVSKRQINTQINDYEFKKFLQKILKFIKSSYATLKKLDILVLQIIIL